MAKTANIRGIGITQVLLSALLLIGANSVSAIMLEVIPSDHQVVVGEQFTIDLAISGLEQQSPNEIVRAYHLDLGFDDLLLSAMHVGFGGYLNPDASMPIFRKYDISAPGNVMLEELSLLQSETLSEIQPDTFVLASIGFKAMNVGMTSLELLPYLEFGIDVKGQDAKILPIQVGHGILDIVPGVVIAEPNVLVLLVLGLVGIMFLPRMKRSLPR